MANERAVGLTIGLPLPQTGCCHVLLSGVGMILMATHHEGNWMPANIRIGNACAFVSYSETGYNTDEYEILVGPGYGWAPCQYGGVPRNAVSSGNCSKGETLYIGRGRYNDNWSVGQVYGTKNCLYIPCESQEIIVYNYEVLVQAPPDTWVPASLENPPSDAVLAGNVSDGTAIYVARAMHEGLMLPATFVPDRGEAYVACNGINRKQEIEVLCGPNYTWLQPHNNDVPSNAIFTDRAHDGKPMIVGRAKYKNSFIPGLVSADCKTVTIPLGKSAVHAEKYEVLIRHHP